MQENNWIHWARGHLFQGRGERDSLVQTVLDLGDEGVTLQRDRLGGGCGGFVFHAASFYRSTGEGPSRPLVPAEDVHRLGAELWAAITPSNDLIYAAYPDSTPTTVRSQIITGAFGVDAVPLPSPTDCYEGTQSNWWQEAGCWDAGRSSSSILAKSRARENSRPPRKLSCLALAQAHPAASRLVPPGPAQERLLRNLSASADQLVIDCWDTIERFAQVLAEQGSMTPVEAERTIRELLRTQRATLMAGRPSTGIR